MPQPERFEVLVLGSGVGGKLIAWHLAQSGHRTAVVERRWRRPRIELMRADPNDPAQQHHGQRLGVPGFYQVNPALAWGVDARVGIEQAAMYLADPLKNLLPRRSAR